MVSGQAQTTASIAGLSSDLRDLQEQVARLEAAIADLLAGHLALEARQLDEFDTVRAAVAASTDDLTARVNAVHDQLRGRE
jgi:septal ring factor EnvC (AmiA/AmiB activator)